MDLWFLPFPPFVHISRTAYCAYYFSGWWKVSGNILLTFCCFIFSLEKKLLRNRFCKSYSNLAHSLMEHPEHSKNSCLRVSDIAKSEFDCNGFLIITATHTLHWTKTDRIETENQLNRRNEQCKYCTLLFNFFTFVAVVCIQKSGKSELKQLKLSILQQKCFI